MPVTTEGKKLDLSKLTDEEAKHVWDVVQRDFDLRKKEEDRLGDLKTKIEKEDTKRELLGSQSSLTESHCIRCLQPFKFLLSSKRQCLDCQLHICKACSCYNKKDQGWLCNACHMVRVHKIGTLEWYHENVRSRFKRFGSAKVMRSLFKRLNGEHSCEMGEHHEYDTQSMPEVHVDGYEEHHVDASVSQYKGRKKTKRRLTVDPFDFKLGGTFSSQSGGRSHQLQELGQHDVLSMEGGRRESILAEADMAAAFHQILVEQHRRPDLEATPHEDCLLHPDGGAFPCRSVSQLSHSSCGSSTAGRPRGGGRSSFLLDSDEEDQRCRLFPLYQSQPALCRHTSRESLGSHPSQISDLDRRMSAIETLLDRIELKVTHDQAPVTPHSTSPLPLLEDVDLEELQLRQKLHELTDNISDHSLTSDEDESSRPHSCQEILAWRSPLLDSKPSRLPSRPTSRASVVTSRLGEERPDAPENSHASDSVERKGQLLDEGSRASFKGSTALLVELEDKVAQAVVSVQNAETEVSFIEDRIAALNAAGMPVDRRRRSAIPIQTRRLSHNFPTSQVDRLVRNSPYRGSLTQRNPEAKTKTRETCAKPVMTQGS